MVSPATYFETIFKFHLNGRKMNQTEKITQWVEFKIGKFLADDIEKTINSEEDSFDVENYSRMLFDTHFSHDTDEISVESLKLDFEPDELYFTDDFSQDSSDDENYFRQLSLDNIISDLQSLSEENQIRGLESLEASSAEELILHKSWTTARKILQDLLKTHSDRVSTHTLEVFRRFLLSNDTPKVVCEGFISLSESISFHIEALNLHKNKISVEEIYDIRQSKWMDSTPSLLGIDTKGEKKDTGVGIIFKSMWLLVQSQRGIPLKWSRFNEKRLREIVFSFVHMLSSSKSLKNGNNITGLDILSVLDPKATWCNNWCHGATGRALLCSALKTNRKLFSDAVDYVLITIKMKESSGVKSDDISCHFKLPPLNEKTRSKSENYNLSEHERSTVFSRGDNTGKQSVRGNRSAPPHQGEERNHSGSNAGDWIIRGISKEVVKEAKFCHCLSMVVYLIRHRGGRSMFPMEVTFRKRRMTIPDFVNIVIDYVNNVVFFSKRDSLTTDVYKEHLLKLVEIIKATGVT